MGRRKKKYPECFMWAVAMRVKKTGASRQSTADELGITPGQVQWWCHKYGVEFLGNLVMTEEVSCEAESMWRDGVSVAKIAETLGINRTTLSHHISNNRPRFPYRKKRKKRKNAKAGMAAREGQDTQRQEVHDVCRRGRPMRDDDLLGWPGKADDVQVQEAPDDQVLA